LPKATLTAHNTLTMPRDRKPSAKIQFLENSSNEWQEHSDMLESTKSERKRERVSKAGKGGKVKKPLTAYMHFSGAMRPEVKEEYPDATFAEIAKIISEWWKDCSGQERAKYEAMAEEQKAAYAKAMGKSYKRTKSKEPKMSYAAMAIEAIKVLKNRKGSAHAAIEKFILAEYPHVDFKRHLLRKALKTAADNGKLVRSGNSFKLPK